MRPRAGFLTTMLAIMVVAAVPVVTPMVIGVQPAAAAVRLGAEVVVEQVALIMVVFVVQEL